MEEMEEIDWKITTTFGALEALSIISSITQEDCMIEWGKTAAWRVNDYISMDFKDLTGDVMFDLDSPNSDVYLIDRIIDKLVDVEIPYKLKLYDTVHNCDYTYTEDEEEIDMNDCVEALTERYENSPQKIWYEEYKDKMDYEEFKKEHPEHFI